MVDTPFFLRPYRSSIDANKKRLEEARLQAQIREAQNAAQPKPKKGLFERAIKGVAGFVPDAVESPLKSAGKATWSGLETWGNQVQSVPAALFTEGVVEDGQYTTRRNIIGNPFQNVASHVAAQRQAGVAPESSGGLLGDIKAGFASARKAGEAFQADPDIPMGVKTATGIGLDPTTYIGAGLLSKAPKIAAVGGAKGKALRAPLSILEGFDNPAQVARFTAGAAAGSQLAENYGIPGVNETVEQLGGTFGGGIGGLLAGKRGGFSQVVKDVDPTLSKIQGREGQPAAMGFQIEWVHPEERVVHATPNVIPEGQIIPSEWGDQGPGHYASREHEATTESYKYGDSDSYKQDYWGNKPWPKPEDKGDVAAPQAYRWRVKRPAAMLIVDEPVTFDELQNIKRAAPKEFTEEWDYLMSIGMPAKGSTVLEVLKKIVGRNAAVGEVLANAGFDGMAGTKNWTPQSGPEQLNFFRPNEILEVDLTPPTMDYSMKAAMAKGDKPVFSPQPTNISQFPSPMPKPEQTWTIGGKKANASTYNLYSKLSSPQKDVVNNLVQNLPQENLHKIVVSVYNDTNTSGNWTSKTGPKPVTPEEIIGTSTTKDSEAFIKEIETGLGKPNEFKSYAPQGQPGAPVAGVANVGKVVKEQLEASGMKPAVDPNPMTTEQKLVKSYEEPFSEAATQKAADEYAALTPAQKAKYDKLKSGQLGPGFKDAPHSVLMKEAKKSSGIFGTIGGGAMPEVLVTPKEIQVGLTTGEKVANAITKVRRFITGSGVANNEVATPIAREYVRINRVLKTQAITMGKMAERAEKVLGISTVDDMVNLDNLTPPQKQVVESLQRSMEAFDETLNQFDAEFDSIHDFVAKIREEEGFENKDFSDILTEYGNAIANKVSDTWLQGEIKKIAEAIDLSDKAGKKIPTSTVSVAKDIKLPRVVGSVLEEAFHKVHPTKSPAYAELFTAINNQLRGMWAAGDASFQGIQMLPTWADNPKAAYQATKIGFETLKDHTVMAEFIRRHDEVRYGTGKPTVTEYVRNGLHIAHALGEGTDLGGISQRIQNIPGYGTFLKKSNTVFTDTGNANRIMIADFLWDQYQNGGVSMLTGIPLKGGTKVGAKEGMTRAQILEAIGEAANRATGYSHRGFGGPYGAALFFAPRFMQSQIEMVAKAVYGNKLENQVARRQLAKLVAIGSALTIAINELNGEETVFDPRDSNFMRIRNVGGLDISVFGPWDTLVRGVIRSVPHITEDGDITLGDPTYLLRSKLSPVLSTTTDWITGENVIGQESRNLETALKNTFLPFSAREIGEESPLATGLGFTGAKASPLTSSEKLENELERAGIKKSDPDYLIKRREYLAANPDSIPESQSKDFKRAQEIQQEIAERRKANDDMAASSQITLTEFRENRKIILTEQRNRLNEVLSKDIKNADSKQKEWLNSYFELFNDETNKDFITGEIDPDAFDTAIAQWANQNGTQALEFINKYMGAGLNPVERAYYNDMRKLEAAGYFDVPKYHRMQSGLTEDEIDSLARIVDSFRAANPDLSEQAWATTAKRVLKESLTNEEILDIIRSRKEAFQNPQREELKRQFGRETLWFNSRADWNSYTNYKPGSGRSVRSRRERRSRRTANVGGILKKTIGA